MQHLLMCGGVLLDSYVFAGIGFYEVDRGTRGVCVGGGIDLG